MLLWHGSCLVHDEFKADELAAMALEHPQAAILVHPESPPAVAAQADVVGSTTQLIYAAGRLPTDTFIVATDQGILHDMRMRYPGKTFLPAPTAGQGATCKSCAMCPWMAMNSLHGVDQALEQGLCAIEVDPGLAAALSLPSHLRVALLSKGAAEECASAWAQGGIAAVLDAGDSIDEHVADTLVAGAGQCDAQAVRALLEQGPAAIDWLVAHGVPFTRDGSGALHLTREGGHGRRRIVHAADCTGQAVHAALLRACRERTNIDLHEHTSALDLLTEGRPAHCRGALVRLPDGRLQRWHAAHTVLATGGLGQVYPYTTNPATATGDGVAMAWRAGCRVGDLEFMQFQPRRCRWTDMRPAWSPRRCAAKARCCACRTARASCPPMTNGPNWRRATSWPGPSGTRWTATAWPSCTWTSATSRVPGCRRISRA
jgi:hypothetical protein